MSLACDNSRVFFEGGTEYTVVRALDTRAAVDGRHALPWHEARWALTRVLASRRGAEIVDVYRAVVRGALPAVDEADVHRMLEALLEAAGRGDIAVFEVRLLGSSARRDVLQEAPSHPTARSATRPQTTWISLVLVDDSDPPEPVPNARYRIELADGSTREGTLDRLGRAWIDGIDPGTCKVSFPAFHAPDWKKVG